MPKVINKDRIREVIMAQTNPFTPHDIAFQTDVSHSTTRTIILELESRGHVAIDHKLGKRIFYGVINRDGVVTGKGSKMMALPVKERFSYVADVVDMVVQGHAPSAMITGLSGIGKTHLVLERFKKANKKKGRDFHVVKGHAAPQGLYCYLHDHPFDTIVFDDCDDVFRNDDSVGILKSALDSYDTRTVSWLASRMPSDYENSFDFEGQIIFISNYDARRMDDAIKSRTLMIDLQMSRVEIVAQMRLIVKRILPKMSINHKLEVINFLDETKDSFEDFDLRTLINVARMKVSCHGKKGRDWRKMAMVAE